jgi:hypothetical protein
LDNPSNIWKAARFVRPATGAVDVLELAIGGQKYSIDKEKATILIDTFFPTPPTPEEADGASTGGGRGRGVWGGAARRRRRDWLAEQSARRAECLPNLRWGPNPTITPYMTTAASHIK